MGDRCRVPTRLPAAIIHDATTARVTRPWVVIAPVVTMLAQMSSTIGLCGRTSRTQMVKMPKQLVLVLLGPCRRLLLMSATEVAKTRAFPTVGHVLARRARARSSVVGDCATMITTAQQSYQDAPSLATSVTKMRQTPPPQRPRHRRHHPQHPRLHLRRLGPLRTRRRKCRQGHGNTSPSLISCGLKALLALTGRRLRQTKFLSSSTVVYGRHLSFTLRTWQTTRTSATLRRMGVVLGIGLEHRASVRMVKTLQLEEIPQRVCSNSGRILMGIAGLWEIRASSCLP